MNVLELKKFRSIHNLSREELAEKIGITIEALNTWEYRTKKIPNDKVERVKYVFDMYNRTYKGLDSKNVLNEPQEDYTNLDDIFLEYEEYKIPLKVFAIMAVENEDLLKKVKIFSNMQELGVAKKLAEITSSAEALRSAL